ncbi:MAG: recombinase [Verrucomicrobiales bacterium]|nr:recombinase [Verrucomicrobiales bacterium]
MSYLLDTNVISESTRPNPDRRVVEFLAQGDLFISAVTIYAIYEGILDRDYGRKKVQLNRWFEKLRSEWRDSILPVDEPVAVKWAEIVQRLKQNSRIIDTEDIIVAATAAAHGLVVATRNIQHFEHTGVEVHNPFSD